MNVFLAIASLVGLGAAIGAWSVEFANRKQRERDKSGRMLIDIPADAREAVRALRLIADAFEEVSERSGTPAAKS